MKTTHAHKTVASIFCLLVWHFVMEVKDLDIPLIPTTSSPNSPLSLYVDCFGPESSYCLIYMGSFFTVRIWQCSSQADVL